MWPVLFHLGSWPIHSYGVMIAIGFLSALAVIRFLAVRENLPIEKTLDLCFYGFFIGLVGARLLYVLTAWDQFARNPLSVFFLWEGGLVFFGGPLAVVPFIYWYAKKYRLPFWKLGDTYLPGLTLAHAFGRIGCLGAGCCYGKPTGTDFGVRLNSELVDPALRNIPLHPTQIYESVALFMLFFGLMWVSKRKRFDGQVVFIYFLAYPVIRSVIEVFRGDLIRGFVIDQILSTSQFISLMVFAAAAVFLKKRLDQVHLGETR